MSSMKKDKKFLFIDGLKAFLIASVICFVLFQGMYSEYQKDIQSHLDDLQSKQSIAWQAATKMFKRGVEARFQSVIDQPEVLSIIEKAQNPAHTQEARLALYRLLYPYYQNRLKQNHGRFHLHFHTADNHSFLRFHQPDKFGDDLSQARPTVVRANRILKPVYAFETGKAISGLRHVFPILYQGKHLGSVELGPQFESLRQEIALFNPQHEYTLIHKRKPLEAKQFDQLSYLFAPSPFSENWLEEDPLRVLPNTPDPLSENMQALAEVAKQDLEIQQALNAGESIAKVYPYQDRHFALTFTPIKDIHQHNISYLVSLSHAEDISHHYELLWSYTTILTLIILLLAFGIWRILCSQRQQTKQKSYLESINNTIHEGLYVTDKRGKITTANAAAIKLLQYSEEELLNRNAHRLFHIPLLSEQGIPYPCPIEKSALQGEAFNGELQFLPKDQVPIQVSVSSQPLFINETLQGSVVSFSDITAKKEQEEALRIAATAFETQEGIMITDPKGQILRVNQAFTKLTGYQLEEVVGLTPKILNSGVQNAEFYKTMWQNLLKNHFWQGEIWNKRKNGEVYLEWLTITAVVNEADEITQFVASFSDVTERHVAQQEIEKLAFYDPLTKLPNRRLLLDRLEHAIVHIHRTKLCGALFFIDLDNFKTLNDSKGHLIGDLLLKEVAMRLSKSVREDDTVSRIGGDEFVILMENLDADKEKAAQQAEHFALNILEMFQQPFLLNHEQHHSSPSIGVEIIGTEHTHSDEVLTHADLAMYQAKKNGRNTVRFFDPDMQVNVEKMADLQADMRQALENDEFELYYQPQVNQYAEIISAEALIRWNHLEKGFISPGDFIPLAEESGLIIPIGDWVLESACKRLVKWQESSSFAGIKLSVNVSAKQFAEKAFVSKVKETLARTGAPANYLKLELTESLVVKDMQQTITTMNALRDIGVRFSMDDFGTGHSSLSYLKRLPLSQLKIDQSFIRDLKADSDDAIIVKTIIAMSNTLKLEVIAEGVETLEQKAFLQENQCHVFQGYLFSRPLPSDDFENLVKTTLTINEQSF